MSKTVTQMFGSGFQDKLGLIMNGGLRTNDVLQQDEWKSLDERLVNPARIPLRAFSDLLENGLEFNLGREGYLSTTQLDWQNQDEVEAAVMTMDGATTTDRDRLNFNTFNVPLPLTIKEFGFSQRNILESRKLGRPLDVSTAEASVRQVSELLENMVVNGNSALTFKGNTLEGYTTATNRMTDGFSNSHWGSGTPSGEDMLTDLLDWITTAETQKFYGPYMVYLPRDASTKIAADFKANSDKSIKDRLLEVDGIIDIKILDKLASTNALLVQMTSDVVEVISGFDPEPVMWEGRGGLIQNFAILAGHSIRIKTDAVSSKSGIVHIS